MATCCFCGQTGKLSREHVWPKWLRKWPAYEAGLQSFGTGQSVREEPVSSLDPDGRIQVSMANVGQESQYLPFVTVPVCSNCNNGWMSQLEQGAKRVLTPLIEGRSHDLNVPDQHLLTFWAVKCFFAYASVFHPQNLPFATEELGALRQRRQAPDGCVVWLGRSKSKFAQVAMSVEPTLVTFVPDGYDNLHSRPAQTAQSYLAAHGVVFIAHWMPELLLDTYDLLFDPLCRGGLTRVSGALTPLSWPTTLIEESLLMTQRTRFLTVLHEAVGLPWEGQTEEEAGRIADRFMAGESPADLRRSATRAEP